MSNVSVRYRSIVPVAFACIFGLSIAVAVLPSIAAAQNVSASSVQTQELIPPGQNSCPAIAVTNVQPYVYNGLLESFDVTISDTSDGYVGILSTVGGNAVPLNFITRWAGSPSGLRIHVDVQDLPVGSGLPVTLTMLASLPNQPTCITSVSFGVSGSGTIAAYTPPANTSPAVSGTGPVENRGTGGGVSTISGTSNNSGSRKNVAAASSTQASSSTGTLIPVVASVSGSGILSSVCAGNNAYRLWLVLLVIYIIIVAIVVFAEPWFLESSVIGSTAAILVPLILLLIFWYFSESCRAASWIPVIACVIAIAGLFLAFREYELPPLLPAPSEH